MFSHDAILEFDYETPARARAVADSVARETGEIDDERSRTTISREAATIRLEVVARDRTALRAALNTWLTLIDVAERSAEVGRRIRADG